MRCWQPIILAISIAGATAGRAQLLPSLPSAPIGLPNLPQAAATVRDAVGTTARTLDAARRDVIARLVRENPDRIALDPQGFPARAGEVVIDAPDDALIARAAARGFSVIEHDDVMGIGFMRLRAPRGHSLKDAIRDLKTLGATGVTADQLHLPSGHVAAMAGSSAPVGGNDAPIVGVIDGGVAGAALSSGFATGAPRANNHGTAVASLITGSGAIRGALPGARIASADIYGSDPAGGNATALAKALGWMVQQRVPVVTISLVGPANPLLARVVAAAQARGLMIVAAVGNNGPGSPPAFPASYPGVVAVTGIDGKNRPLIEAGRSNHVDYAAPAADMLAAGVDGRALKVRGTSFAAPFVAGIIARSHRTLDPADVGGTIRKVDALARDLGPRGPDKLYGRGVLCGDCRTPEK